MACYPIFFANFAEARKSLADSTQGKERRAPLAGQRRHRVVRTAGTRNGRLFVGLRRLRSPQRSRQAGQQPAEGIAG